MNNKSTAYQVILFQPGSEVVFITGSSTQIAERTATFLLESENKSVIISKTDSTLTKRVFTKLAERAKKSKKLRKALSKSKVVLTQCFSDNVRQYLYNVCQELDVEVYFTSSATKEVLDTAIDADEKTIVVTSDKTTSDKNEVHGYVESMNNPNVAVVTLSELKEKLKEVKMAELSLFHLDDNEHDECLTILEKVLSDFEIQGMNIINSKSSENYIKNAILKNPKTVKNMSDNNAKVTMLNSGSAFTTKHDPSQVKINQSFEHLLKLYKRTHNAGESVSELVNQQLKDGLLIESEIYWGGND